ncbi:MAG TPA: CRTAC1 family protein [Planctomycetota bacterium]|nr:CRTAC1 family protein [Planctomycetota bacterium]
MFTSPRWVWLGMALVALPACAKKKEVEKPKGVTAPTIHTMATGDFAPVDFEPAPDNLGLDFVHTSGADGRKLLPETMGGGVCLFDADGDGDLDLYLTNGKAWTSTPEHTTGQFYEMRDGRFVNATAQVGLAGPEMEVVGQGCIAGDYDGDGDLDLFVTCFGSNLLLQNQGGTFTNVAGAAGVEGATWTDEKGVSRPQWSTSAGFCDLDGDGWLDLFVCNYLEWCVENDVAFTLTGDVKGYASPKLYRGSTSRLYKNTGKGTFTDVTESSGILSINHKALGVAFADVNRDGKLDILVANDTQPNCLFVNKGDMTFEDIGVQSGIAYGVDGGVRAGMGIDAAYYAKADELAIAVGNFSQEPISFFRTKGTRRIVFADDNVTAGLGRTSGPSLTFSTAFLDANLDGYSDLLAINGHLEPDIAMLTSSTSFRQKPQLFVNTGVNGRLEDHSAQAGSVFQSAIVGRGLALGDLDQDGDVDAVVTECGGPAHVWINQNPSKTQSLRLQLAGHAPNTFAVGARVTVEGGPYVQSAWVRTGQAYLSQHEMTLTFGLGKATEANVSILWPDGTETQNPGLKVGTQHRLVEP